MVTPMIRAKRKYNEVYEFSVEKTGIEPEIFVERCKKFEWSPDPFLGVCLANKSKHTVMLDTECDVEIPFPRLSFDKKDKPDNNPPFLRRSDLCSTALRGNIQNLDSSLSIFQILK